jgi:hypothetical protein
MHDIWDKLINFPYHLALYVIWKMLWYGLENKYSEPFVYDESPRTQGDKLSGLVLMQDNH